TGTFSIATGAGGSYTNNFTATVLAASTINTVSVSGGNLATITTLAPHNLPVGTLVSIGAVTGAISAAAGSVTATATAATITTATPLSQAVGTTFVTTINGVSTITGINGNTFTATVTGASTFAIAGTFT